MNQAFKATNTLLLAHLWVPFSDRHPFKKNLRRGKKSTAPLDKSETVRFFIPIRKYTPQIGDWWLKGV